jgi:hypothetical protein
MLMPLHPPVLWIRIQNWIRIRKDPKLFAESRSGTGSGTRGYGSGFGTGHEPYQKSSKKISNLIIMALRKINITFLLKRML